MPNKQGFDELVERGNIQLHCIWCGYRPPKLLTERQQKLHARTHRKDAEAAAEASKREVTTAQSAIAV